MVICCPDVTGLIRSVMSHLEDDDSRCVVDQETLSGLQLLSDEEPSTCSLQTDDEGFPAPPEGAATVQTRHTADNVLQVET